MPNRSGLPWAVFRDHEAYGLPVMATEYGKVMNGLYGRTCSPTFCGHVVHMQMQSM